VKGRLSSWSKRSKNIIRTGPTLSFFRALTDNDETDGKDWTAKEVKHLGPQTRSVTWTSDSGTSSAVIKCIQRMAPPALEWSIDAVITYTFYDTHVVIHVTGRPQGINLPLTLPRIGLNLSISADFNKVTWFGRGPGESYKDKKLSQKFGNYSALIDELAPEYEFPQESGNHTETRWVRFEGSEGVALTAKFLNKPEGFDFEASHYEISDVDKARHPFELRKLRKDEVIVRLDMDHHGLGTDSCGRSNLRVLSPPPCDDKFEII
jgi:beta-galactosidase